MTKLKNDRFGFVKRNHKAMNNVVMFQSTTRLAPGCWFIFEESTSTFNCVLSKTCALMLVCRLLRKLSNQVSFGSRAKQTNRTNVKSRSHAVTLNKLWQLLVKDSRIKPRHETIYQTSLLAIPFLRLSLARFVFANHFWFTKSIFVSKFLAFESPKNHEKLVSRTKCRLL